MIQECGLKYRRVECWGVTWSLDSRSMIYMNNSAAAAKRRRNVKKCFRIGFRVEMWDLLTCIMYWLLHINLVLTVTNPNVDEILSFKRKQLKFQRLKKWCEFLKIQQTICHAVFHSLKNFHSICLPSWQCLLACQTPSLICAFNKFWYAFMLSTRNFLLFRCANIHLI